LLGGILLSEVRRNQIVRQNQNVDYDASEVGSEENLKNIATQTGILVDKAGFS
jgi:hypothetical protein